MEASVIPTIEQIYEMATAEAAKSKCQKRKVGAIIIDRFGKVLARGHNYHPDGLCCEDSDGYTRAEVIHAEVAAINNIPADKRAIASKIYITHPPCENCKEAIAKLHIPYEVVPAFLKFDKDKLRYGLIPPEVLKGLAEVLTYGAKKYKPDNWKLGDKERYLDALYRHLEAWRMGEIQDSESKLPHLAHALTNIAFLYYLDIQNRP